MLTFLNLESNPAHLGTAQKKTGLTYLKKKKCAHLSERGSNPAYVPDTSVRPLNSSLSLGIVKSKPLPSPELIFP